MDDDIEVQIITPPVADETDPVDHGLVALTQAISQLDEDSVAHGGLGGEFGYGARYENAVFVMRPFYWGGCDCGAEAADTDHLPSCAMMLPNFQHKASGLEVRWYKWIGRDTEIDHADGVNIGEVFADCLASLSSPTEKDDGHGRG